MFGLTSTLPCRANFVIMTKYDFFGARLVSLSNVLANVNFSEVNFCSDFHMNCHIHVYDFNVTENVSYMVLDQCFSRCKH